MEIVKLKSSSFRARFAARLPISLQRKRALMVLIIKEQKKMNKEEIKNLLYALHHSTYRNEQQIKNSKDCGCFHCKTIFKPEDVTDWCDNDGKGERTGRCPNCRMDSVLGDNSGVDITPDLLELMNLQFFGSGIDHVNVTVSNSNQTEESNEHNR